MHARRGQRNLLDILDAFGGFQQGVDQDRFLDAMPRFELGQQLVEIMDVPGAFDLGQHDDVELVADGADDFGHIVEQPGRIQAIHARPQARRAVVMGEAHFNKALAGRFLGVGGNGVFEIAEDDIGLGDGLADLGADLFQMRRHEMDHPLDPHRQFPVRGWRADRQRLKKFSRAFRHGLGFRSLAPLSGPRIG